MYKKRNTLQTQAQIQALPLYIYIFCLFKVFYYCSPFVCIVYKSDLRTYARQFKRLIDIRLEDGSPSTQPQFRTYPSCRSAAWRLPPPRCSGWPSSDCNIAEATSMAYEQIKNDLGLPASFHSCSNLIYCVCTGDFASACSERCFLVDRIEQKKLSNFCSLIDAHLLPITIMSTHADILYP